MELNLDDLFETCPVCKGTGKQSEPPLSGGRTYGTYPLGSFTGDVTDCNACGGYGRGKLTQTGEALLDFLRILQRRSMI